jgi:hypothetical protein
MSIKNMYLFLIGVLSLLHCPQVVRHALEPALRELYFVGPRLHGYGFWNGLQPADICAQLTQTPSDVWRGFSALQCSTLTEQYFQAFYVGAYSLLYVLILYYTLTTFQQMYLFNHQLRLFTNVKEIKNN